MNRSLIILIGALALGAAIFCGSFFATRHVTVVCCVKPSDDLAWLQSEFHLSNPDMARIRQLHEGYLPKCGEICAQIGDKRRELNSLLGSSTNINAAAQLKLDEIAGLRAECQSNMLQHFLAVSQAMPPEEGKRYLAEMKKMTLGEHEQIEQTMSDDSGHEHHHH
jgi:hypothetical protein